MHLAVRNSYLVFGGEVFVEWVRYSVFGSTRHSFAPYFQSSNSEGVPSQISENKFSTQIQRHAGGEERTVRRRGQHRNFGDYGRYCRF